MMRIFMRLLTRRSLPDEELPTPDLSRIFPELRRAEPEGNDTVADKDAAKPEASGNDEPANLPAAETGSPEMNGDDIPGPLEPAEFSDWLAGDLEQMRENFHALRDLPTSPRRIRALFLSAHNLRGTAEPYGYPIIGRICTSLCRLLEDIEDAEPDLALINLHVEASSAAARTGGAAASEELADTVCRSLEEKVDLRAARR